MWWISLVCGILILACIRWSEYGLKGPEFLVNVISVLLMPICLICLGKYDLTYQISWVDRIIQALAIIVAWIMIKIVISEGWASGCTYWCMICLFIFTIFAVCFIWHEQTNNQEKVVDVVAWDTVNFETSISEYTIMGISGESIVVKVSYNDEETLRTIPLTQLKIKTRADVLAPYVYRENYIYTEYNYAKTPPEPLRKDSSSWSDYYLCGSEKQIQSLFGYELDFNFEQ